MPLMSSRWIGHDECTNESLGEIRWKLDIFWKIANPNTAIIYTSNETIWGNNGSN